MVREYKYLGFLITPSLNLHTALTDLRDRGLRAYGALKTKLGDLFKKHILTTTHLFDSLVKPILLYASDFWGCLKLPRTNPVENLHIKFCKELLGVGKYTTNIGVLLELGRYPLLIYGKKNAAKNWERIAKKQNANPIILSSYHNSQQNGWASSIKGCFSSIGLLDAFLNTTPGPSKAPNTLLLCREKYIFQQSALSEIRTMSKLHTYCFLKQDALSEKYLISVQNVSDRIALTRFRLSNHNLMIEKGRHQNITRISDRTCPFCPGQVETEFHFLLKCSTFTNLREHLLTQVKARIIGFFYPPNEEFLFWFLLRNPDISHLTA